MCPGRLRTEGVQHLQAFYRQSSRELRRLSSVARSPVYSGFSEALDGAPTIRGFSAQAPFSQQNVDALEVLQRANFAGGLCSPGLRGARDYLLVLLLQLAISSPLCSGCEPHTNLHACALLASWVLLCILDTQVAHHRAFDGSEKSIRHEPQLLTQA